MVLRPFSEQPSRFTFEFPTVSPYDSPHGEKTRWNSRNFLHLQGSFVGSWFFRIEVCSVSHHLLMQCHGFEEFEPQNIDDVSTSYPTTGTFYSNFETLDAHDRNGSQEHLDVFELQEGSPVGRQRAQKDERFLRERQIAHMISEHVGTAGTSESILEFSDIMTITLRWNDDQGFDSKWEAVLLLVSEVPKDDKFESIYKTELRDSCR